jgi:hypothetical protein
LAPVYTFKKKDKRASFYLLELEDRLNRPKYLILSNLHSILQQPHHEQ